MEGIGNEISDFRFQIADLRFKIEDYILRGTTQNHTRNHAEQVTTRLSLVDRYCLEFGAWNFYGLWLITLPHQSQMAGCKTPPFQNFVKNRIM